MTVARRYASPLIAQRRARILAEVKQLVEEVGGDAFTLRDLAMRAGVSVTTIYNIFGDKETLVALALREFDAGISLDLPDDAGDLAGFLDVISHTTEVVLANRAYALALADLYFSRSLSETFFQLVRSMPLHVYSHWLQRAQAAGLLCGRMSIAAAEASYDNLEWGSVKDWGAGRIADAELPAARHRSFLIMVIADGVAPIAERAGEMLAALGRGPRVRLV